ncbi:MAG: tetratricopeptide repeat protein [Myxococcales bacterium]|nr:tetratricopeptide repeat protein [Myxococcales bacterium]
MNSHRILPLCLLLCLVCSGTWAWAGQAEVLWNRATGAMASGDDAQAEALLAELERDYPQDILADDALFLAGKLLEEKLGDPKKARERYRTLLANFPDSRSALAAQRRLARLDEGLGTLGEGASIVSEFQEILRDYPGRNPDESLRLAKQLAENNPDWSQLHTIHLWIAATTRRTGDLRDASIHFQKAIQGSTPAPAQIDALLGFTEVAILRGKYEGAREALTQLGKRGDLSRSDVHAISDLGEFLSSSKRRRILLRGSIVVFILAQMLFLGLVRRQAGSWRGALSVLCRPSMEFFYMLPLAALLITMALTGHQEIGPAVAIICTGGLITTYLATAALEASKALTTSQALVCAFASVCATVCACYLALQRSQLVDLVLTTVRFGPE